MILMSSPDLLPAKDAVPPKSRRFGRRGIASIAALLAAVALGAGVTAVVEGRREIAFAPLPPASIKAMQEWSAVAVKGQVAEIFGNKFIVQDDSGRALVDSGPAGEGDNLVAPSETVTVQGRFERGAIHAAVISHADGRNDIVGPLGPPPRGRPFWRGAEGFLHRMFASHPARNG
jgi:hypothetical protein